MPPDCCKQLRGFLFRPFAQSEGMQPSYPVGPPATHMGHKRKSTTGYYAHLTSRHKPDDTGDRKGRIKTRVKTYVTRGRPKAPSLLPDREFPASCPHVKSELAKGSPNRALVRVGPTGPYASHLRPTKNRRPPSATPDRRQVASRLWPGMRLWERRIGFRRELTPHIKTAGQSRVSRGYTPATNHHHPERRTCSPFSGREHPSPGTLRSPAQAFSASAPRHHRGNRP